MDRQFESPARKPGEIEGLLEDLAWLGTLAHRLIADSALAEDACQEAWLAATSSGTVSRNELFNRLRSFASSARRSGRRRRRREAASARHEALPSTEELLSRGEQQRRLWQFLRELEEPFRSALLLRFQEDLDTTTIAERLGVPADTVRWRIRRGLELLRGSLKRDERGGGLAAIALAVPASIDFTTGPGAASIASTAKPIVKTIGAASVGALWMMKPLGWLAAAAVVALMGTLGWQWAREAPTSPPVLSNPGSVMLVAKLSAPEERLATPEERMIEERAPAPILADDERNPNVVEAIVVGRLVDEDEQPLEGVEVAIEIKQWSRSATSSQDGQFELRTPVQTTEELSIVISGSEYLEQKIVRVGSTRRSEFTALVDSRLGSTDLGTLTLRSAGVITGRLIDPNGAGIADAWISSSGSSGAQQSDVNGRFRLARVLPGSRMLDINARGYLDLESAVALPPQETVDVGDLRLTDGPRVRGLVTDIDGTPLRDAKVSSRGFTRGWVFEAGDDGRFEIPMPTTSARGVSARAPGFLQNDPVLVEPGAEVNIRLEWAGEAARFEVVDKASGEPIQRFGLRIHRGAGSKAKNRVIAGWNRPRIRARESNIAESIARAGVDEVDVVADGYLRTETDVLPSALAGGQRIELSRAPGIRGRLVRDGVPVRGQELKVLTGELSLLSYAKGEDEREEVAKDDPRRTILRAQGGYPMFKAHALDEPLPHYRVGNIGSYPQFEKVRTDEQGRFHFANLEVGAYRVLAEVDDLFASSEITPLGANDHVDIGDIVLAAPATVRGRIVPNSSGDLAGHTLTIYGQASTTTDSKGEFLFPALPPGDHHLRVGLEDGLFADDSTQDFYLRTTSGEVREIELDIDSRDARVLEIVALHNGAPIQEAHISFSATEKGGPGNSTMTDASGRGTVTLPLAVELSGVIWFRQSDIEWARPREYGPSDETIRIELQTGSLTLVLPPDFEYPEHPRALLHWRGADGSTRRPLQADVRSVVAADPDAPLQLTFETVPVDAAGLELEIRQGARHGSGEKVARWPFEVLLTPGGTETAQL